MQKKLQHYDYVYMIVNFKFIFLVPDTHSLSNNCIEPKLNNQEKIKIKHTQIIFNRPAFKQENFLVSFRMLVCT
jgi:hypothetical protein